MFRMIFILLKFFYAIAKIEVEKKLTMQLLFIIQQKLEELELIQTQNGSLLSTF